MARSERPVADLVDEDPGMRAALDEILDRAEDGPVHWRDVKDAEAVSSGHWGRLIQAGVLVDGDDGFELADPDAAREAVETGGVAPVTTDAPDPEELGDSSWTTYDKAALVAVLPFFAAYTYQPLRDAIGGTVDVVLGPVAAALPFYAVVMLLALLTGLYSTILQATLMNTEVLAAYQAQMQELKERREAAKARDDEEALEAIQEEQMEMMGDQLGMMKEQFRPMVWIMFVTIPVFLWMYWALGIGGGEPHVAVTTVAGTDAEVVLPLVGSADWKTAVAGPLQAWILWYFLCSVGFSQVIRKGLDFDVTPS